MEGKTAQRFEIEKIIAKTAFFLSHGLQSKYTIVTFDLPVRRRKRRMNCTPSASKGTERDRNPATIRTLLIFCR